MRGWKGKGETLSHWTRIVFALQADCGDCVYCKDKPKFGGKGTKRQKCTQKRLPQMLEPRVSAAIRLLTNSEVSRPSSGSGLHLE